MIPIPLSDALLAHAVPNVDTASAIARVGAIKTPAALDHAEVGEVALNGRSAVIAAIAKRRTQLREAGVA